MLCYEIARETWFGGRVSGRFELGFALLLDVSMGCWQLSRCFVEMSGSVRPKEPGSLQKGGIELL